MTGDKDKFRDLNEIVHGYVKFGNESKVRIEGKGSIVFQCKNGELRKLDEVYYIPDLFSNIISLGQLAEGGDEIKIKDPFLWVHDTTGNLLVKVQRSPNRLYKIELEEVRTMCLSARISDPTWLWHVRMGHINFNSMKFMAEKKLIEGMPKLNIPPQPCEGCLVGKQTRNPFPTHTSYRAKKRLELIHGDLCGPVSPPTPSGNRYFMLLVDDYSRVMWVYLLKTKDEALQVFKNFRGKVEVETGEKMKVFRTDRGGEFLSNQFTTYCNETGLERHYTSPYSPQQNGVVERRNRTVLEMVRCNLKTMSMPDVLWGEAVTHSVYVLNRAHTKALKESTPYEMWTGRKPHVGHLRVFGCVAHMRVAKGHLKKLDERSMRLVHLGVEKGTKAYRLLDPNTGKIYVSRDVVFEEPQAWMWENSTKIKETPGMSFTVEGFNLDELYIDEDESELRTPQQGVGSPQSDSNWTENSQPIDSQPIDSHSSPQSIPVNPPGTPQSPLTPNSSIASSSTASSSTGGGAPKRYRLLTDLYDETEEIDELMMIRNDEEPVSYTEASKKREWVEAMDAELSSIEKNKTWNLVDLPKNRKAIGLKWVYKVKRDPSGKILKHKARIVAKGYVQKQGIDYDEVFAPVARIETVRVILALSGSNGWRVHHLDVKSAFLNGALEEEVYVSQPEGYVKRGEVNKVYKLSKALYGLKQAPRAWNACLDKYLKSLGFTRCAQEYSVYTKKEGENILIIGVYVDDLLVTGNCHKSIQDFKKDMKAKFEMSDLGPLTYYLGIEVSQKETGITLKQEAYARSILSKTRMIDCNPTKSPMEHKLKLTKDGEGELVNPTEYRSIVGGLRYLTHTRPDISFAVGVVSRFMEKPTEQHLQAVKRILRYVKGTLDYGLTYTKGESKVTITGYSDSDLANDVNDRKSTGGMAFYVNGNLVTWASQKQRVVALSSCEAEFIAATMAACQGIWLRRLLTEVTRQWIPPVTLFVDNQSALELMKNPVFHGRSKHIDIRFHFIRECVENGEITVAHVCGKEQKADILTKPLAKVKHEEMRNLMGIKKV
ncbi:putative RNA-directed DNA polymerase [Tanacetum coccineum]|uniref:RNA-directed DNA polymerase n=1 Tax=Tanacetum coccineum TaxID=301880 RepID=A0ABQ5IF12_9ASTR